MNNHNSKLSVIIASVHGFPVIGECLDSVHQQSDKVELEVIVANRCTVGVDTVLFQKYPWIKLIEAPPHTTVPQLRALALRNTSNQVVAVLEDHCIVEADWARRMLEAHQGEYPVIGGSIENGACERLVDWAAFFCEYSQAMKPAPEGEVDNIPGNNVSYKRWLLEHFHESIDAGVWDFVFHDHIKKSHFPLYSIPSISVRHKLSASLGWFVSQKFHFARSYAGIRFPKSDWLRRASYAAGTVVLPIMLAHKIVSCVWRKGKHRRELLLSFPILVLLLLSWGLGEAVGYIFGEGSSPAKVA